MDGYSEAAVLVEYRWGHGDGLTSLDTFGTGDEEKFVTCGSDSDLRVWKDFEDEDPVAHGLSDVGICLTCGKDQAYVGTDFNKVEAVSLTDGKSLGEKARFTAPVHHIDLSKDEKWLVAGSGDMTIKLINLEDSSEPPVTIDTHTAPVLSVALDPLKRYLASSGCDGNVCIWSLSEEGKPVHMEKKMENVFPSSNDISTSQTLCRMSWEANGKLLAIPEEDHVALYARDSWAKLKVLKPKSSKQITSVVKFSQCGKYLAAGGSDGSLIVWDVSRSCVLAEEALFNDLITAITFANNECNIIAADNKGRILSIKAFKTLITTTSKPNSSKGQVGSTNDNIDDELDDDLASPASSQHSRSEPEDGDMFNDGMDDLFDDVDDNEISISKIKAETGFVGDEYVGVDKAKKVIVGGELGAKSKSDDEDDDIASVSSLGSIRRSRPKTTAAPPPPEIIIPFTEPQDPFQPGSSPSHLDHRFMVWNSAGIIRNYSHEDDEKQAIDIEFHDAAIHHAVHLRNQHDYTIATLTKEVAVFANEKLSDVGSKLFCYSFTAWDSKKEWFTDLPLGEEVVGLAAGDGWIAVSTDKNRVRIFTIGGAQRQIIEIGGQIIATSGHEDLLFISFHNGIGLHGNQCLAFSIFRIKPTMKPFPLVSTDSLPMSPKSQITWIGFSDEGTPVYTDSENVLRILSGRYWTTFCALKDQAVCGSSDNFWVVGVSELDQRIRAVKCRGMKYPPTLPRPVLMQLDAQMPFCEMETEKSRFEDKLHRSLMLDALSKKMDKKNYEVDEYRTKAEKELKESLFNLFVLSCKGDWDARGAEYVSMMPTAHAVQVAVKFASKQRKKGLVDRLTTIGRRKLDEEELEAEGDDDDFETLKMGTIVYSNVQNRTLSLEYSASQDLFSENTSSRFNQSSSSLSTSFSTANRSVITVPEDENPFMKRNTEEIRKLLGAADTSGNRFRKDKPKTSEETGDSSKGLSAIDSWKKPSEKATDLFSKASARNTRGGKKAAEKDKAKEQTANKDKKKQTTLHDLQKKTKENIGINSNPASPFVPDTSEELEDGDVLVENEGPAASHQHDSSRNSSESLLEETTNLQREDKVEEPKKPKTGFLLWFDENQEGLAKKHPDLDPSELVKKIGMPLFRNLPADEKKKYANPKNDDKKRKRSEAGEDLSNNCGGDSGKKSKVAAKLALFARVNDEYLNN